MSALTPRHYALLAFGLAFAAIAGAWGFEAAGIAPCELCLLQRWPYYIGVPFAALLGLAMPVLPNGTGRAGLLLLALLFVASAGLGIYHAGVEWGFWQGPAACTGSFKFGGDLLADLKNTKVVRCDAVAIRILGLSLAGWNVLVSLVIAAVAGWGTRRIAAPKHQSL